MGWLASISDTTSISLIESGNWAPSITQCLSLLQNRVTDLHLHHCVYLSYRIGRLHHNNGTIDVTILDMVVVMIYFCYFWQCSSVSVSVWNLTLYLTQFDSLHTVRCQKAIHTEAVARHWRSTSLHSNNFWTIFKKLSTKRFSDCAWQVTSSVSNASMAMFTELK